MKDAPATEATVPFEVPRRNGELAFDAPWESRAFGLAAAYLDATGQPWERFRERLMAAIGRLPPETAYYEAWLVALDQLLADDGLHSPTI